MVELTNAASAGSKLHEGKPYRTPLLPILAFAGGLPILGAAQMALAEYRSQTKAKIEANQLRAGGAIRDEGKPSVGARPALSIDAAELVFRDVLRELMEQRDQATMETRSTWLSRMAHSVITCREAVQDICSVTGASGGRLDNPVQRALRDATIGSNHMMFDRETGYAEYGRILLGQPMQSPVV